MEVLDQEYKSNKDPELMAEAKRRVGFKWGLMTYIIVNFVFWCIWFVTGRGHPWPIWPMLGWGIGLFFHYLSAYKKNDLFSVDKEYEQLKKKRF